MSAPRVHPGASAAFAAVLVLALAGGAPARAGGADPGFDPGASLAAPKPTSHRFT